MKDNPKYTLLVEGHADERGTREYNLALSERRAKAVEDFYQPLVCHLLMLKLWVMVKKNQLIMVQMNQHGPKIEEQNFSLLSSETFKLIIFLALSAFPQSESDKEFIELYLKIQALEKEIALIAQ